MLSSRQIRKSQKQPEKNLDSYVASIKYLQEQEDPESIPDLNFHSTNFLFGIGDPAEYVAPDSQELPLGFNLKINGKIYKTFSVSLHGWMVLRDPDSSSGSIIEDILQKIDIGFGVNSASMFNDTILNQFLNYDHILLAPWFGDIVSVIKDFNTLVNEGIYPKFSSDPEKETNIKNVKMGIDTTNYPYDNADYGVRYVNFYDDKKGNCLLVRWTTSQNGFNDKLKFEVAIYESGKIEFKYWSLNTKFESTLVDPPDIPATCGIFWSGANIGPNKFRDFSSILGYRREERNISNLGGAIYDSGYYEVIPFPYPPDNTPNKPYSINLSRMYWPKNGGIITFSPPVNSAKFLPRKIAKDIANTREIVRPPGLFDDRKSINFSSGSINTIQMPSTLFSRLIGDTGDVDISLRQLLFTSGSLEVTGSMNQTVVDSLLLQLDAFEKLNKNSDFSFNEFQHNYSTTNDLSDFYSTGSSIELFGEGFSSPLSSKTQFSFSLPVTKPTMFPPTTSSIHYYNADKKKWTMVAPEDCTGHFQVSSRNIEGMKSRVQVFSDTKSGFYTVSETSRGFDSIGRKIVSGSEHLGYSNIGGAPQTNGEVSSKNIGALYYSTAPDVGIIPIDTPSRILDATTTAQSNSLTDNPSYYPSNSQTISFPIEQPFLIEKIVVDIPLTAGNNWFSDLTTCTRAFGGRGGTGGILGIGSTGSPIGPFDFGGPGLTFSIMCARRASKDASYVDLIASGTITHEFDNFANVFLYKDTGMNDYHLRPIGFRSFSNPSAVISRNNNLAFTGSVRLQLEAATSSGLTLAIEDRSASTESNNHVTSNREKIIDLLTSPTRNLKAVELNQFDGAGMLPDVDSVAIEDYKNRSPRVYIQQISPFSRGSSKFEFGGNSILGGMIASNDISQPVKNPLYVSTSGSLPAELKSKIDSNNFTAIAFNLCSTFASRPSPYLIFPGDKITLAMSKTRPVVYKALFEEHVMIGDDDTYRNYILTGSHDISFNTGTVNLTFYGSYVRNGMEYNP